MNEPLMIELYAQNRCCCILRREEILGAFAEGAAAAELDWETACEFLACYTNSSGSCRLELDRILDGTTLNYPKTVAVFMIFAALLQKGDMGKLPPQVAVMAVPYVTSRTNAAELHLAKFQRLDAFVTRAAQALEDDENSDRSVDDIFAELTGNMPAVSSFATVRGEMRENYRSFFEMLYEKAQACADPGYAVMMGDYLEALQ